MASVYGYEIDSEVSLSRLRSGVAARGTIQVRVVDEDLLAEDAELVSLALGPDETPVFAVARTPRNLLTWCQVTGTARIDPGSSGIELSREANLAAQEDRLLNTLVPLLLAQRGELLLHAAAIAADAGAVIVCGPSGRGKSTLAAVLGDQGWPVLAEDAIALTLEDDRVLAWPGPTGVRLAPAAARGLGREGSILVREKAMDPLPAPASAGAPVMVAAIVVLRPRGGSELEVRFAGGPDAVAEVYPSMTRLDATTWPDSFRCTAELVRRVPCHTARLPDDLGRAAQLGPRLIDAVTTRRPTA